MAFGSFVGGSPVNNSCDNAAALTNRWLIAGVIAATTAADAFSLTAGFTSRGGTRVSAPLLKSGASGGSLPVNKEYSVAPSE